MPRQPKSETPWEFLPDDDDLMESEQPGPEDAAMHVEIVEKGAVRDVGRQDVALGPAGDRGDVSEPSVTYFDDEVSEVADLGESDEDEESDVEDLLIAQHYLPSEESDDS